MRELRFAVKHTVPVFFTYVFLGIAFGVLMSGAGYGVWFSAAAAVFIFAGSMQFAMVPMMASGASLLSLALTTFFINARHIFYGVGFLEKFRRMGPYRPYMIFALTDETYSVLCAARFDGDVDETAASFLIAVLDHAYWVLGCVLGACAGAYLSFDLRGVEFSAAAFFLVVVVDLWRERRSKLPFLAAAVLATAFRFLLGKDYFLIPTLVSCLAVLLLLRGPVERKEGTGDA